jgi:hypothetical protein
LYATDVEGENGPFEYIPGSHLPSLRAASLNDGRYDDRWLQSRYPVGVLSMLGKSGDVFMVDTQGIHRGKPAERGCAVSCSSIFPTASWLRTRAKPPFLCNCFVSLNLLNLFPEIRMLNFRAGKAR